MGTVLSLLNKSKNCDYLCMQKLKQYGDWQSKLDKYCELENTKKVISNILCEIETSIKELLMYKYVAETKLMQLDDPDAVNIIKLYYFGNVPLDLISDDYDGDIDYVKKCFNEALNALDNMEPGTT